MSLSPQDIATYRLLGISHLETLLAKTDQLVDTDYFIDQSIRVLSKLPARPASAAPYVGLFGNLSSLEAYRQKASARLAKLVTALSEFQDIDAGIDHQIRMLSKLPARPSNVDPYTRLFKLPAGGLGRNGRPVSVKGIKSFITSQQLIKIAGTSELADIMQEFADGVNETFNRFNINTPLRIAHFLAQVMHESGGFRYMREIWGPTDWQIGYEGREDLGNIYPGDGKRYMGRGLIQLTGRANYEEFSRSIGVDFVARPELVEQSPYAVMAAGWYWDSRDINRAADEDDLVRVTRLINGGTLGIDDRAAYLDAAKAVLGI